jgi:hypothetical protein
MRPSKTSSVLHGTLAALALLFTLRSPLSAQSRVKTPSAVLAAPNGRAIGSVRPGVELRVIETRGSYAKVAVGGYVERAALSARGGSASPRVGNRSAVLRVRAASTARSVASFDAGTRVTLGTAAAPKGWVRVSREGWVLRSALETPAAAVAARTAPGKRTPFTASKAPGAARRSSAGDVASRDGTARKPPESPPPATKAAATTPPPTAPTVANTLSDSTLSPTSNVALRAAPDARPLATVAPGASLVPLARDRGWVRVRLEGWVPERDVTLADTSVRSNISAADLRADPQGSRGKVVRWNVQVLASQKADALRRDLNPDETYLLARGPDEENALLYLVVPPALLPIAKSIPELSQALIAARVRTGRSALVGVPILDLLTLVPRK